jgi:hypothetical protein
MQEFESISASSYDPSALATKLTAKAAEGWSVVAIVPTGGDVTAFVSREKGGATESTSSEETESEAGEAPDTTDDETPAFELPATTEPESEPAVEPQAEPVTEPSGWAIAPEPASTTPEPTGVHPTVSPTSTYQPGATPTYDPMPASTPSVTTPAAATPEAATPAEAATPTAPAVPAGWYADPAGRFELRYWDGGTWTEHVSRAGQQFTDPPVA